MPSINDGVIRITDDEWLSDGICMRKEHLPVFYQWLTEVERSDFSEEMRREFDSGASMTVKGVTEDNDTLLVSCNSCMDECEQRSITTYTFPDSNTARTVNYCAACTNELKDDIKAYIDGREDEFLADVL